MDGPDAVLEQARTALDRMRMRYRQGLLLREEVLRQRAACYEAGVRALEAQGRGEAAALLRAFWGIPDPAPDAPPGLDRPVPDGIYALPLADGARFLAASPPPDRVFSWDITGPRGEREALSLRLTQAGEERDARGRLFRRWQGKGRLDGYQWADVVLTIPADTPDRAELLYKAYADRKSPRWQAWEEWREPWEARRREAALAWFEREICGM